MKKIILLLMVCSFTVFADDKVVVGSDATEVLEQVTSEVTSELITVERAEELGLNRATTYEVSSTVSIDNLEHNISEKVKESKVPFYSVKFNKATQADSNYRAEVTEYFSKVE
ncbi:hypothetical protein [Photobacterium profundum]|uniref:DUF3316 domain-containing protein n=1 Tax=Photobacterium profundum (strain SS9) TaxID=298386 RepID=Q6LP29_PHOPR|nr:hypothetical protein [Photobacterium profundum]CAG20947.1 hypothetical protein PBPRA2568 [Photobacterium profundum SS9]